MNMKRWLNDLRMAEKKKPMPVLSFPSISLMGITVRELIADSETQARGMKLIADRVDALAAMSMMDLSVEAEAFGSQIRVSDEEVPTVTGSIVHSEEDAEALRVPAVGEGRTGNYIEAIGQAKKLIMDRPVFAGVIGPFSLAARLMDVSEAMICCYDEPDMVHCVMRKVTEFLIAYIQKYKKVCADGVVIAEPVTGILSPALAEEFSEPYSKQIVDTVQDEGFIVIYHNCGNNTIRMIDSILRVGASAYHFGNAISMHEMLKHIPQDIVAMGNVDPSMQFRNGTPESVREATQRVLSECAQHRNFVISSGCDIPPMAPWENIDAFFEAVKEFHAS